MKIEWSEKMSVGNMTIDQQHKTLITLVNTIYDAMGRGKGDEVLEETVSKLTVYVKNHFTHEEKFMRQCGYPGLAAHQQTHRGLTEKVQEISQKMKAGQKFSSVSLAGFLKDWLVNHIMMEDKKYAAFAGAGAI